MKIIITGASGFIGQQLVPRLENYGHELLLVGRSLEKLQALFANKKICQYQDIPNLTKKYDILLHLAVQNNHQTVSKSEFENVNITFLLKIAEYAKKAGIEHFINLTTTHTLILKDGDNYGLSKRKGEISLNSSNLKKITHFHLPAVYGDSFQGKLSLINIVPKFIRRFILNLFALLKPIVSIEILASAINDKILKFDNAKYFNNLLREHIILSDKQKNNKLFHFQKRLIDIIACLCILFFFWWIYVIVALVVALTSSGPAVFAQARVGRDKKIFTCYKFRTMSVDTPDQATHMVSTAQLTKTGKFLRGTKLDELPQVINILKNEMSLVGPRPCLPSQIELVEARDELSVFEIKPGITGLAQVQQIDMSDALRLANVDARYAVMQTALGDMVLLVRTLLGGGQGDRVRKA